MECPGRLEGAHETQTQTERSVEELMVMRWVWETHGTASPLSLWRPLFGKIERKAVGVNAHTGSISSIYN